MDKCLRGVSILLFIHRTIVPDEVSRLGIGKHILHNGLVASVDISLRVLADINVSKSRGGSLCSEEGVKHERIQAVVIPSSVCEVRIILGGEQHLIIDILAVVEDRLAINVLLVVPIHHNTLIVGIHLVIIDILGDIHRSRTKLTLKLRVRLHQDVIVSKLYMEEITGLLNIHDTRFPKQIDKVYLANRDISKAVQLGLVPKDTVNSRTHLQLVVHHI